MKRYILFLSTFFALLSVNAQNQAIPTWDDVQNFDRQSLPQSALEAVNLIYSDALYRGDSSNLIKALLHKLKYKTDIDTDSIPTMLLEIEHYAAGKSVGKERSVLYSLLSEMYLMYYRANSYKINRRTPGIDGDDIETWSAKAFIQRVADYVQESLLPVEELQATDVLEYREILTEGDDSRGLRPTLYDFLAHRAIGLLEEFARDEDVQGFFLQTKLSGRENFADAGDEFVKEKIIITGYDFAPLILRLYQDLLTFRLRENNTFALLMVDLDRLKFVRNHTEQSSEYYLSALNDLEEKYNKEDYCVEILLAKANFFAGNYSPEHEQDKYYNERQIYEICKDGIERFSNYRRAGNLKDRIKNITQGALSVVSDNTVYLGQELQLEINHRNINAIRVDIYRIDAPVSAYINRWERNGKYKDSGKLVDSRLFGLRHDLPYVFYDTLLSVPVKGLGNYEYVIYPDKHIEDLVINQQFSVSKLASVSRYVDGKREYIVAERKTGKPVEGAQVHLYERGKDKNIKVQTIITDRHGLAVGTNEDKAITNYNVTLLNDSSLITSSVPWVSNIHDTNERNSKLDLFTDRSIYRPGETVNFKGIAYDLKNRKVLAGKSFTVGLYDGSNRKKITEKEFKTNEYGSFSGEFVLPLGSLKGNYLIQSHLGNGNYSYANIRIEEYKKPGFEIRFDGIDKAYRFGDEVTVTGDVRSFSAVNIKGAVLRYRILRSYHSFCRIWKSPLQVAAGEVVTDGSGRFNITFTPEKSFEDKGKERIAYVYEVEASVTDIKGETQQGRTKFNTGDKPIILSVAGLKPEMNRDSIGEIKIDARNLDYNPVSIKGKIRIVSLKPKNTGLLKDDSNEWTENKLIKETGFESGKSIEIPKSLSSGKYRIIATALDAEGVSVDFLSFSFSDKRPPVFAYQWFVPVKTECDAGEKAEILYGSSAKDVYVLHEIFKGNKKLASTRFKLSNETRRIEIPFLESYGEGVKASFLFIKDGNVFHNEVPIFRKQPDNELRLSKEVFRDRLLPGQREEWKISVKDAANKSVAGEVLAAMYDASLDNIEPHKWSFKPITPVSVISPQMHEGEDFGVARKSNNMPFDTLKGKDFTFDVLNSFGINFPVSGRFPELRLAQVGYGIANLKDKTGWESANAVTDGETETVQVPLQIRRNFSETAFFYPHITTGESGEAKILFTVPESNTTWKFMAIAHTKDLKYGEMIEEVITRKDLMVTPNIPRFIRTGDRMTLTAAIDNLSEREISGSVSIEIFDPTTGKTVIIVPDSEKSFTIEAGSTTSAGWDFEVPEGIDLAAVKIIALTDNFSDGEQHLVPVLPKHIPVVESIAINTGDQSASVFSFPDTNDNHRMTLEITANPIWYAIQALPVITAPQSDNIIDLFAAYYSNSVATEIVNSNPRIRKIIEAWTQEGNLISNLEKNSELKTIQIEETPFAADAGNETEQRQSLAKLFDVNRADNINRQAIDKIRERQNNDGGWGWFHGMNSSSNITQWILWAMANGSQEMQDGNNLKDLKEKAIHYIDNEIIRQYKQSDPPATALTSANLEYLLVRSYYTDIPLGKALEAHNYFLDITERNRMKTATPCDRAIAALALHRNGKFNAAKAVMKSLREHAIHKPDDGMYWSNSRQGAFHFRSSALVQAIIMNVFHEIGSSQSEMDEMKLWLLRQKQIQRWENAPATVSAVQTLIKTGNNQLDEENKVTVKWGNRVIASKLGEAGTGYIKISAEERDIVPEMNRVTVITSGEKPVWGALYRQYFEDAGKISAAGTGMSINKDMFIEKTANTGKFLQKIDSTNLLRVGERVIVRLTVRVDRDYEYVILKDLRAPAMEPAGQKSGMDYQQGVAFYRSPADASINLYFPTLPKGVYVFEYALHVSAAGVYSTGTATLQSMYAPEFTAHSEGKRIEITKN
ncbi:MAG: hypothetical protein LBS54_04510 [Dysgonamonadaceae bacterium]|jgi:uncharacterized protein YfaS (alpha-2-macroglobulin family)|nr:hypothetical protein [Dysgonamonadaceae bacterium]